MTTSSSAPEPRYLPDEVEEPDVSHLVTEDDQPADNIYSEKQQRLLTAPLYAAWPGPPPGEDGAPRKFLACANVGLFPALHEPPIVPDVFVSIDVEPHQDLWDKRHRTYLFWEFGKPPEVVIEVVSNREGGELRKKKRRYARLRIAHYVVWDPGRHLGEEALHVFELRGELYVPVSSAQFEGVGLGLTRWEGPFEGAAKEWLRWCLPDGTLVPMGAEEHERAEAEHERAEAEHERAEAEHERAEAERQRAEELAARLRALGAPDE